MKNSILFWFILYALFANAQSGYLGKNNEIGVSLFDVLVQQNMNVQYKKFVSSHIGFIADGQVQVLKKALLVSDEAHPGRLIEYGDIFGSSYSFGLGVITCLPSTGSPFPYGNYLGLTIHKGAALYSESRDSIHLKTNYFNSFYSFRLFVGKTVYLKENWLLDMGVQLGATTGVLHNLDENDFTPTAMIPMQYVSVYVSPGRLVNNETSYTCFVFNPLLKLCYIF